MTGAGYVVIIADQGDPTQTSLRIQNFEQDGKSFIPIFTSKRVFEELAEGSPFIDKGLSIDLEMLLGMLTGDETLIINPGSKAPWNLTAQKRR